MSHRSQDEEVDAEEVDAEEAANSDEEAQDGLLSRDDSQDDDAPNFKLLCKQWYFDDVFDFQEAVRDANIYCPKRMETKTEEDKIEEDKREHARRRYKDIQTIYSMSGAPSMYKVADVAELDRKQMIAHFEEYHKRPGKLQFDTAGRKPLHNVLCGGDGHNIHYVVPELQRPYTWKAPNVQKLMDSLISLHKTQRDMHPLKDICIYNDGKERHANQYYIVDGQQRLLTLVILISVVRYRLEKILRGHGLQQTLQHPPSHTVQDLGCPPAELARQQAEEEHALRATADPLPLYHNGMPVWQNQEQAAMAAGGSGSGGQGSNEQGSAAAGGSSMGSHGSGVQVASAKRQLSDPADPQSRTKQAKVEVQSGYLDNETRQIVQETIDKATKCLNFKTDANVRDANRLCRIYCKRGQLGFWQEYVVPEKDNLGAIWDENGNLREDAAKSNGGGQEGHLDMAALRMMEAADVINTALTKSQNQLTSPEQLRQFLDKTLMSDTMLTVSVFKQGEEKDVARLFEAFNDTGVVLSDYDKFHSFVLGGDLEGRLHPIWSEKWDHYYVALSYWSAREHANINPKSRQAKDMFEKAFEVVRFTFLRLRKQGVKRPIPNLRQFMLEKEYMNIASGADTFMDGFFLPILKAMDMIFNWRLYMVKDFMGQQHFNSENALLQDKICSILRSFAELCLNTEQTALADVWLPVACQLLAAFGSKFPDKPGCDLEYLRRLLDMLQSFERRVAWHYLVPGSYARLSTAIDIAQRFLAALNKKEDFPTAMAKTANYAAKETAKAALALDAQEAVALAFALVSRQGTRSYHSMYVLMMYDDVLRQRMNRPIVNYRKQLEEEKDGPSLDHLLPIGCNQAEWDQAWFAPKKYDGKGDENSLFESFNDSFANYLIVPRSANSSAGKSHLAEKAEVFRTADVVYYSTPLTFDEHKKNGRYSWTPTDFINEFVKKVALIGALRLGLETSLLAHAMAIYLPCKVPHPKFAPPYRVICQRPRGKKKALQPMQEHEVKEKVTDLVEKAKRLQDSLKGRNSSSVHNVKKNNPEFWLMAEEDDVKQRIMSYL